MADRRRHIVECWVRGEKPGTSSDKTVAAVTREFSTHGEWRDTAYLYVLHFSNGRVKVGMTWSWSQRLNHYERYAKREKRKIVGLQLLGKLDKKLALKIEAAACLRLRAFVVPASTEWFSGGAATFDLACEVLCGLCGVPL